MVFNKQYNRFKKKGENNARRNNNIWKTSCGRIFE